MPAQLKLECPPPCPAAIQLRYTDFIHSHWTLGKTFLLYKDILLLATLFVLLQWCNYHFSTFVPHYFSDFWEMLNIKTILEESKIHSLSNYNTNAWMQNYVLQNNFPP